MDYDNTDSGAAFPPLEGQHLILTGKIDNGGEARPHAIIKDTNQDGESILVVYKRVGVMYENADADESNKRPHYSGPIDNDRRISAWRAEKGDRKYLSIKISDKRPQQSDAAEPQSTKPADIPDIPF